MDEVEYFAAGQPVSVVPVGAPDHRLDYLAPEGGVGPGALVEVPLGPRRVLGAVWGAGAGDVAAERLRAIIRVLDLPPLRAELRAFLERAADYTLTPLPAMLRLATRAPGLAAPAGEVRLYRRGAGRPDRETTARAQVLDVLEAHGGAGFALGELARLAGVSASVVKGLVASGAVIEEHRPRDRPYAALDPARPGPDLTPDQARAAARLGAGVAEGGFGVTLLKGVTGAGKTEVYLAAVAEALQAGRQVLVLLPEIALTESFLARVEVRFGAHTIMARTRMQAARPVAARVRLAAWARPLETLRSEAAEIRRGVSRVQLGGPTGDRAALGADAAPIAADMARRLALAPPVGVWHTNRQAIVACGDWLSRITGALGKIGADIALMAQQGVDAVRLSGGGSSSSMPHKANPVLAELMVTLARYNATQVSGLHHALVHEQERSGAAWMLEWMLLAPMTMATGRALTGADTLLEHVVALGEPPPGGG